MSAMSDAILLSARTVSLPWAFLLAMMTAMASFGGAYVSTQAAIHANQQTNEEQSKAIIALSTRVQNIEADERVHEVTRRQTQKDVAGTAAALGAFQDDVRNRLETLQTTLIQLQVTLGAIKEASDLTSTPGTLERRVR